MSKILKREQYNNGYGCQCCRRDWEEIEWVDKEELPDIMEFFSNSLPTFSKNCNDGGIVGVQYEKDGRVLFGVYAEIHRAVWFFYARKGMVGFEDEMEIPVQYSNGLPSFDLTGLTNFYGINKTEI